LAEIIEIDPVASRFGLVNNAFAANSARVLPGDYTPPAAEVSTEEAFIATIQRENWIASARSLSGLGPKDTNESPENWNPYTYIREKWTPEQQRQADLWVRQGLFENALNPAQVERQWANLQKEKALAERANGDLAGSLLGGIFAMALDPITYVGAGWAVNGVGMAGKAGRLALQSGLSQGATEGALQLIQQQRALHESLFNVGAATVFGGGIGAMIDGVPRALLGTANGANEIARRLDPEAEARAAGAAVTPKDLLGPRTVDVLDGEAPIKAGGTTILDRILGGVGPLRSPMYTLFTATSDVARNAFFRMADTRGTYLADSTGRIVRSPDNAEAVRDLYRSQWFSQWEARMNDTMQEVNKTLATQGVRKMDNQDFLTVVQRLMRGLENTRQFRDLETELRAKYGDQGFETMRAGAQKSVDDMHNINTQEIEPRLVQLGMLRDETKTLAIKTQLDALRAARDTEVEKLVQQAAIARATAKRDTTSGAMAKDSVGAADELVSEARQRWRAQIDPLAEAWQKEMTKPAPLGKAYGHAQQYNRKAILADPAGFEAILVRKLVDSGPTEEWLVDFAQMTRKEFDDLLLKEPAEHARILKEWAGDEHFIRIHQAEQRVREAEDRLKLAEDDLRYAASYAERADMLLERDAAKAAKNTLKLKQAERDAAQAERDALVLEKRGAQAQRDLKAQMLKDAESELQAVESTPAGPLPGTENLKFGDLSGAGNGQIGPKLRLLTEDVVSKLMPGIRLSVMTNKKRLPGAQAQNKTSDAHIESMPDGSFNIVIRDGLSDDKTISALVHELGHALQFTRFDKLDPGSPEFVNIMASWRNTKKDAAQSRGVEGLLLAGNESGARHIAENGLGGDSWATYAKDFKEWFAESFRRWSIADAPAQGPLQQFFENTRQFLQEILDRAASLLGRKNPVATDFRNWVTREYDEGADRITKWQAERQTARDTARIKYAERTQEVAEIEGRITEIEVSLRQAEARIKDLDERLAPLREADANYEALLKHRKDARKELDGAVKTAKETRNLTAKNVGELKRALLGAEKRPAILDEVKRIQQAIMDEGKVPGKLDDGAELLTGRLKERRIKWTDQEEADLAERGFLRSDMMSVVDGQMRELAGQVALRETFGIGAENSPYSSWGSVIEKVKGDYDRMVREATGDAKRVGALNTERQKVVEALDGLHRRLIYKNFPDVDSDSVAYWGAEKFRQFATIRFGSGYGFSSLTDFASLMLWHRVGDVLPLFFRNSIKAMGRLDKSQIEALVTTSEMGLHAMGPSRSRVDADSIFRDGIGAHGTMLNKVTGAVDRVMDKGVQLSLLAGGLPLMTRHVKSVAAATMLLELRRDVAKFASLSNAQKARYAMLGLDEARAARIQKYMDQHGRTTDYGFDPRTEDWGVTREALEAARDLHVVLSRDMNLSSPTAGIADTPLFMDRPVGRFLMQLQTYAYVFYNRVAAPGIQKATQVGDYRMLTYLALSIPLALTTILGRDIISGRDPMDRFKEGNEHKLMLTLMDRIGFFGWAKPYLDSGLKAVGQDGVSSSMSANTAFQSLLGVPGAQAVEMFKLVNAVADGDEARAQRSALQLSPMNFHARAFGHLLNEATN
jgi:hypothetical protein